jgi:hypothetical protein
VSKKRPTRKDKERRQAREQKVIGAAERARVRVEELLTGPPKEADCAAACEALACARESGVPEDWGRAIAWVASADRSDEELAEIISDVAGGESTDRRFIFGCQSVISLYQSGRAGAALLVGRCLAATDLPARAPRTCADAIRFLAANNDEAWVADLLRVLPDGLGSNRAASPVISEERVAAGALQMAGLFWDRTGGAHAIRGFDYQNEVGLLYVVRSMDATWGIEAVGFERLEDIELQLREGERHPDLVDLSDRVYIQAKSRNASQGNWTIARLAEEGVLQHFAELHAADPFGDMLFLSNREISATAAALSALCRKLRASGLTAAQLAALPAESQLRPTDAENLAARDLAVRVDAQEWDDDRLSAFLARLHMRQLPHGLQDTAVVALGRITSQSVGTAELAWYRLYHEVFEQSGRREFITSDRAAALVREVTEFVASAVGGATDASHLIRKLDLSASPAPDPAYLLGVRATPRHILAGQDAVRPQVNEDISAAFAHHNLCIVRSPSGQGKSTCMYRWAADHSDRFRVFEVDRVADMRQVQVISDLVGAAVPTAQEPVLILLDDLFSGDKSQLNALLERLGGKPHVYILATSREDEWRDIRPRGISVGVVRLGLDDATAAALRDMLERGGVRLEMRWREALELAQARTGTALLMEYLHYLQRGESLEQTLREQLSRLDTLYPDLAESLHSTVRCVATLDTYGCSISWAGLEAILGARAADLRRCIDILKDEHLILERTTTELIGLHRLRSEVLASICAETVPLAATAAHLLSALPPAELVALAEPVLADAAVDPVPLLGILWDRVVSEVFDATLIPQLLKAVFAADQRRFAAKCQEELNRLQVRSTVLALLYSERLPDGRQVGLFDLEQMPPDARAARDALPKRSPEEALLHQFLQRDHLDDLASKLRKLSVASLAATLDWIGCGNARSAVALLPLLRLRDDPARFANANAVEVAAMMSAVRRIDPAAAEGLYAELGGDDAFVAKLLSEDYRVTRLVQAAPSSWELEWSLRGSRPGLAWPAIRTRAGDPDGISWELGQLVLRAVPRAESVEVWAKDETGGMLGFRDYRAGLKHVVRENSYEREDVDRNVVWADAFLRPYRATTWAALAHALQQPRELAVALALELAAFLVDTFPTDDGEAPARIVVSDSLDAKGERLHRLSHSLPFLPISVPGKQQTEQQDGRPTETLPTYFDRLLNALQFFVLGVNDQDEHKSVLAPINAGMAVSEQQEMLSFLAGKGRDDLINPQLAVEERRALSALYALIRTCRRRGFGRAKAISRNTPPLLRGCHQALRLAAEASGPDGAVGDIEGGRLLAHAVRLSDELTSHCAGSRTLLVGQLIRPCQADPAAAGERLEDCLALCEDLDDPVGAALAAEVVEGADLQRWQSEIDAAVTAASMPAFTITHAAATVAPQSDKHGFRPRQVLLGVPSAQYADGLDACADALAAVARTVSGEPCELKIMPVAGDGVLPEVGWLLHVGGHDEPADREEVQRRWFPFVPDADDAARLGLPMAQKSTISEAVDAGFGHLVSGLSWAVWMATENARRDPALRARIEHITGSCETGAAEDLDGLVQIGATLDQERNGVHGAFVEEVQLWLGDCGGCVERHLRTAREANADDRFLSLLGTLLRGQPVTDAGQVSPEDLGLMVRHWELKATAVAAYGAG